MVHRRASTKLHDRGHRTYTRDSSTRHPQLHTMEDRQHHSRRRERTRRQLRRTRTSRRLQHRQSTTPSHQLLHTALLESTRCTHHQARHQHHAHVRRRTAPRDTQRQGTCQRRRIDSIRKRNSRTWRRNRQLSLWRMARRHGRNRPHTCAQLERPSMVQNRSRSTL